MRVWLWHWRKNFPSHIIIQHIDVTVNHLKILITFRPCLAGGRENRKDGELDNPSEGNGEGGGVLSLMEFAMKGMNENNNNNNFLVWYKNARERKYFTCRIITLSLVPS